MACLVLGGAAVVVSGCVSSSLSSEAQGTTRARYAGAVPVMFTNATPARMCGLYMTDDREDDYGDNWLPEAGVPSGGSVQFRIRPGKYKARWDTCRETPTRPYFAATLWREAAVNVGQRETQLYAYVADSVAPTKRARAMGRDHNVVRFPGQPIDPTPQQRPRTQQVALRASESNESNEPPQIAGFIGRVMLSAEIVAELAAEAEAGEAEPFDAREFVDARARPAGVPPAKPKPSLSRKHDLSSSGIEYRKR
jgi:hypothetical protein